MFLLRKHFSSIPVVGNACFGVFSPLIPGWEKPFVFPDGRIHGACWSEIRGLNAEHDVCSPFPPCVRVRVPVWQRNICAYAVVIVVKMAEGETEKEYDTPKAIEELRERFQALTTALKESTKSPLEASLLFCQDFCQVSGGEILLLIPG